LARHQLAVDDDVGVVWREARVHGADLFEDGLRIVRNQEPAPEETLQVAVSFERISGHSAAPIRSGTFPSAIAPWQIAPTTLLRAQK
jgi:hypothetical protein